MSSRVISQSLSGRPLPPRRPLCSPASAGGCPRRPGHSSRQAWQWTHRSADALNSSLASRLRSTPPGEDAANHVRLRPRRRLLGGGEAEDRAHPHLRGLRAALAATIARRRVVSHPRRVPVQLQFDQVAQLRRVAVGPGRRAIPPAATASARTQVRASAAPDRRRRSCPG